MKSEGEPALVTTDTLSALVQKSLNLIACAVDQKSDIFGLTNQGVLESLPS